MNWQAISLCKYLQLRRELRISLDILLSFYGKYELFLMGNSFAYFDSSLNFHLKCKIWFNKIRELFTVLKKLFLVLRYVALKLAEICGKTIFDFM